MSTPHHSLPSNEQNIQLSKKSLKVMIENFCTQKSTCKDKTSYCANLKVAGTRDNNGFKFYLRVRSGKFVHLWL